MFDRFFMPILVGVRATSLVSEELRSISYMSMLLADGGSTTIVTQSGIGLGTVIAVVCSWHRNRSILWAILAGVLSWFYVIYFALTRRPDETLSAR
jgi:hypothetical protein